jgi:hypothetical protein
MRIEIEYAAQRIRLTHQCRRECGILLQRLAIQRARFGECGKRLLIALPQRIGTPRELFRVQRRNRQCENTSLFGVDNCVFYLIGEARNEDLSALAMPGILKLEPVAP